MAESSLGRNRVFQIKNDDGTPFHNLVLHKATYDSVVMSLGDKITGDVYYKDNKLDVTMNEYIEFARDPDDSSEEPVKFILVNPPTIVKEGIVSDNSELKGMTKYSFEFYHPMCKLGNMPLTDIAVTQDEERYLSQNKTFSWCGTGNDFIAKLNANLYYSEWIVVASENEQSAQRLAMMPSEVPTKKAGEQAKSNVLSFDKNTIADGLKTIYETWDIPFVVDALHQGEYYDADGRDYYSEEGGNKRFVVIVGMPSNEIIDTESEFGVVVNATQIANGNIYYGGQPISVQKGKKIVLQSLTDGATPMILNSNHNGVIGTTSKTFETDMTIYVGLYPKSGYVKYFYDGDGDNVFVFRYGQGVGLKNNSRTPRNNKIITRISASGSEDNIPYGYPQIQWTGSKDDPRLKYPLYKGIVGGQYVTLIKHPFTRTRLMPSVYVESVNKKVNPNHPLYDPDTELVDYYDADSTYENPIIASSPSYEIHEFDGIKPELDSDRQIAIQGAIPLNDDLTPADSWVDDLKPDTDEYAQSYFGITLPPLGFDVYACASITQQMQINMRSGECIGCTFEIQVDWDDYKANFYDSNGNFDPAIGQGHPRDAQKYPNSTSSSINVVVKKEISTFGTLMPNIYQQPKSGDLFVILGISLPQIYITNAQQRLDALAKQYMRENNTYYFDYPLKFDEYFLAKYPSILRQIRTNTIIRFDYAGQTLHLCVKQITIKFGEKQLPQYNITLTDNIDVVLNQISQIANDVSRISTMAYQNAKQTGSGGSGNAQDKLSKLIDDTANGIITFAKGIKIGLQQLFGWDADGNITANNISADENISAGGRLNVGGNGSIGGDLHVSGVFDAIEAKINSLQSHNYSGSNLGDTGWKLTNNDGSGNSLLEVDKLLVRMKATFMELEIRKETFSGGNNHYSPAGSVIFKVDFLNEDGNALGYRNQKVPWLLRGIAFLFGNKSYTRQRHIRYAFTLDQLTPEEYAQVAKFRCYLISDDGTTATRNWWQVGDQPRCQSFNKAITREDKRAKPYDTSTPGTVDPATPLTSDFWWRLITEVGSKQLDDGKVYDFIDLPFELYYKYQKEYALHPENFCAAGSGYPQEGDTIVCMGNRVDPARMNLVSIISVATDYSNAPAIKAWRGIHTFSFDGCEVFGFSYEKVRVQSRSFEWITDDGTYLPNILERGAYESGVRYHWYDRVSHNGSMWLCLIADAKVWVDAAGEPIATPSTADIVTGEGVYVYDQQNNRKDRYYKLAVRNGATYGYYVQNWTSDEPTDTNNNWLKQVVRGTDGITITDCIVRYAASLSGVTPPNVESYWKTTIEATGVKPGQYLWTRSTTYYSDNRQPTVEYSVARWGIDGDGIASIDSFYWATTDVVAMTKAWDEAHLLPWNASASQEAKRSMWAPTYSDLETVWGAGNMQGMYVWEKTVIKYDMAPNPDGTPVTKADAISYQCNRIGTDGLIGEEEYYFLASSNDFATVFGNPSQAASYYYAKTGVRWYTEDTPSTTDLPAAENYRLSSTTPNICTSASQQTTATTPIWSPTMPVYAGDEKKYLWNFEQRVDGSGTQYATKPICLGNHARGITGVLELYALSSSKTPISEERPIPTDINNNNTWGVIPTSGFDNPNVWGDERYDRAPTEQYPYQWNWTRTLYSDGGYEDHYHVSAVRGTNGEDGAGEESIFILKTSQTWSGTLPKNISVGEVNPGFDQQGKPKVANGTETDRQIDDWVPNGWTDNPRGISYTNQYEFVSTRKLGTPDSQGRKQWGDFSDPVLRSNWGRAGIDGDGVEYVFIRTKSNVAPVVRYDDNKNRTDAASGTRKYTDDDYLPCVYANGRTDIEINYGTSAYPECSDDHKGTNETWPFEWSLIRRKQAPNVETGERIWECYGGKVSGDTQEMSSWGNYAENAIRLALDNEHEDFLYDDAGILISPSGGATSEIHLYDGNTDRSGYITNLSVDFTKSSGVPSSGATGCPTISNYVLSVPSLTADSAEVVVKALYNGTYYYAKFTANKTSQDKYDLVISPNAIAYNSAIYTAQTITVSGTRTDLNGNKSTLGFGTGATDISSVSGSGKIRLFMTYVNTSGVEITIQKITSTYSVQPSIASRNTGIYFELRKYKNASGGNDSEYNICDYETVEIAKSENGNNGNDAVVYALEPSPTSVNFRSNAAGEFSGSQTIICAIKKTVGNNLPETIASGTDGLYLYYAPINAMGSYSAYPSGGVTIAAASAIDPTYPTTGVNFVLSKSSTVSGMMAKKVKEFLVPVICDGRRGSVGATGKMFYPMGTWESGKTYTRTSLSVPLVFLESNTYNAAIGAYGNYWYLNVDSSSNRPGDGGDWVEASDFGFVITQGIFAEFAKLGSAIMSGDYMFSANGRIFNTEYALGTNWNTYSAYTLFAGDPSANAFSKIYSNFYFYTYWTSLYNAVSYSKDEIVVMRIYCDTLILSGGTMKVCVFGSSQLTNIQYWNASTSQWVTASEVTVSDSVECIIRFVVPSDGSYNLKAKLVNSSASSGNIYGYITRLLFEPTWWVDLKTGKQSSARGNFVADGDAVRISNLSKTVALSWGNTFFRTLESDGSTSMYIYIKRITGEKHVNTPVLAAKYGLKVGDYFKLTEGMIASGEFDSSGMLDADYDERDFVPCVGMADIVCLMDGNPQEAYDTTWPDYGYVFLPRPQDFKGKTIEVRHNITFGTGHANISAVNYDDDIYSGGNYVMAQAPYLDTNQSSATYRKIVFPDFHYPGSAAYLTFSAGKVIVFYSNGLRWISLSRKG